MSDYLRCFMPTHFKGWFGRKKFQNLSIHKSLILINQNTTKIANLNQGSKYAKFEFLLPKSPETKNRKIRDIIMEISGGK